MKWNGKFGLMLPPCLEQGQGFMVEYEGGSKELRVMGMAMNVACKQIRCFLTFCCVTMARGMNGVIYSRHLIKGRACSSHRQPE